MAQAPLSRFPIRITAAGDDPDQATIDDFAQTLRRELIDAGAHRIERVPAGPGPEGTRSLELIGLLSFIITATDAGESLAKVIRAIRAVAQRYAKARRPVQVTVGESDVDLATADDQRIASVIAAIEASRPTGVRAALIVANAAYDHAGLTELRAPGADADALAGVLRDPTIGGFDVELITDADERTIRRRLAAFFARRDRDDVLLLHFSCHGVKDFRGRLYFAARDTDLDALGATAVPASFVNDLLDETMAGRVVLILDCCYSGAFARGAATRGDDAVHVNDEFGGGTGRIVLTASSATEYAFEGTAITRADGQPSVFTSALVEGLASGSADLDEDGDISIDELYDYTYRTVRRATPGQAPMKWSYGVEGAVVIARSGRLPALPRTVLDDLDSDRGVLRMEGVKALQRILRDGTPGLRAAAMEALARLKDNDDSLRVRQAADSALSSIIPAQAAGPRAESGPAGGPPTTVTTPRPGAAHVSTAGSASTPAAFGQRPATTPEPATHRGAQAAPS
ncbi:MAG TPA: caspase family protein, partial [Micromonosporaceae bacterium]